MSPVPLIDYGLRDYGVSGQIGLEPTPTEYVDKLVAVFREVRRVLRDDGTLWLNLGDSYATSPPGNKEPPKDIDGVYKRRMERQTGHGEDIGRIWKKPKDMGLKPKDMVGIPWRVAFALQADGWWLRSDIIWHKPNPMPESVKDRPTKSHEYIFLLAKSQRYYYDAEAIKEPSKDPDDDRGERGNQKRIPTDMVAGIRNSGVYPMANKRSVWTVTTKPYSGAHFAVFPDALIEPCILAGTSEKGCCPKCGSSWERVVNATKYEPEIVSKGNRFVDDSRGDKTRKLSGKEYNEQVKRETVGWKPTCDCDAGEPIPATVLDPFNGAGTTGIVSIKHNRNYIGIELNPAYIELTKQRMNGTAVYLEGIL